MPETASKFAFLEQADERLRRRLWGTKEASSSIIL